MAARLPRAGRDRRALVGHDHLGEGPLPSGRRTASRWAGPTISGSTSRSGTAGPRGPPVSGTAGAIRATSGPSRAPPPPRCNPTQKPLALVERAIENSSPPGATVLDPFCGAGTTLIACERTGRRGIGVEIDPRYVAATIARWEAFTGEAGVPLAPGGGPDG